MLREQFIAILVAEGISAPNADGIWKCRPEFMPAVDLTEEDVRATARALIKEFPEYGPYQEGRAAEFAARAHATQKRKYSDEPYIVHPCAVVQIARPFVTEDGLCAAWLHDVVEDCGIQLDRIRSEFGKRVCEIVSGLTSWTKHPDAPEADRLGNRAERKARGPRVLIEARRRDADDQGRGSTRQLMVDRRQRS